jgi:hypothetical protein
VWCSLQQNHRASLVTTLAVDTASFSPAAASGFRDCATVTEDRQEALMGAAFLASWPWDNLGIYKVRNHAIEFPLYDRPICACSMLSFLGILLTK